MSRGDQLPLEGLRVLELGNFIAAPTAGRMFADFGAEVIKVERPSTGDELRNWRLYAGTTSMLFHTINRNKKSIALDLRSEAGRSAVLELVAVCDVVIENFRPGTLERWNLGPDELERVNPDVVLVRVSAFGQTGPMSARPGFAAVAEAMGGLRELVGEPDSPPARVGVSIGDSIAGLYAAFGALMMLYRRERCVGHGETAGDKVPLSHRTVDVALNESVLSVMESLVADQCAYGVRRTRTGGRMEGIAPSNAYMCQDDFSVVIAGNGDGIFQRLMAVMDRPDLAARADLRSNAGRWDRRDELDEAIGDWTRRHTRQEVLSALTEAGVPAGPIYTASDICADEQYRARRMVQYLDVQVDGDRPVPVGFSGIVPVLGDGSLPIRSAGPALGEHTAEVLNELIGWDAEMVSRLSEATPRG